MKYHHLVLLAAVILAGCGALVSVFGLGALFAGAGTTVLVMVGGLEFAKLVGTAALHRYWDKLSWVLKLPFALAIVIMVGLTSLGIYGFLSDGYQKTASQYEIQVGKTDILSDKSAVFSNRILSNEKVVENKNKRAETLSALRAQQEVRLDSLYAKNYISNANKVRKDIEAATEEIRKLNSDVDAILVSNGALADSVNVYTGKIHAVEEASTITAELGPLIYLSNLTGLPMDTVVNYLIFIIIGVFDPTAIGLLILASSILKIEEKKRAGEPEPEKKVKRNHLAEVVERFKNFKLPKATVDPNESSDDQDILLPSPDYDDEGVNPNVKVDPETGHIDLKYDGLLEDEDIYIGLRDESKSEPIVKLDDNGTFKVPVEPIDKGIVAKGKIDAEDVEQIRKNDKGRGYSVDVPKPKQITEAPEPTKLGKTWTRKKKWL